ncbi:hypothetical protein L345_09460, partial [Ophiophagus hannah]
RANHWSAIIGGSHSKNYVLWEYGGYASEGVKQVAELGSPVKMEEEIRQQCTYPDEAKMIAEVRKTNETNLPPFKKERFPSFVELVGISVTRCGFLRKLLLGRLLLLQRLSTGNACQSTMELLSNPNLMECLFAASFNVHTSCHLDAVQSQTSLASDIEPNQTYNFALLSFNQSSVVNIECEEEQHLKLWDEYQYTRRDGNDDNKQPLTCTPIPPRRPPKKQFWENKFAQAMIIKNCDSWAEICCKTLVFKHYKTETAMGIVGNINWLDLGVDDKDLCNAFSLHARPIRGSPAYQAFYTIESSLFAPLM